MMLTSIVSSWPSSQIRTPSYKNARLLLQSATGGKLTIDEIASKMPISYLKSLIYFWCCYLRRCRKWVIVKSNGYGAGTVIDGATTIVVRLHSGKTVYC